MTQHQPPIKRLYRSKTDRILFGVCGGSGEYFRVDPVIIRVIFVALVFAGGFGIFLYLVLAILTPGAPSTVTPGAETSAGSTDLKERVGGLAAELKRYRGSATARQWLGGIVVLLGVLLLLDRFLPIHIFSWGVFWAIVLILTGLLVLVTSKKSA